ncbi:Zn-dependent oxidoreductase [Cupriavidus taiwanensis]|uniref:Starvation-sensing protein, putative oxidoreductase, Zn-dependent and NAD(P)-binding n=1 Tax=Cupriavidus taiwanensis (strain DSM 17343 / BCRC 17206 / CCUG 44338 / CIP 107171 / LMG 19424 / R1) TaxID=977880 RepID=B3R766_CUPTR|nr:Zn-dependent oxidoreductase [Cupriavidus taiwanensis]CAQ70766.1 starvation-sensing protein, putative oxidoreductase, Zn-dependent and NAD(P)-binding [Cupriavidus taiwanensis LMG 19424]
MLSIVVEQPHRMAVRERADPSPAAGEVRVRVRLAGICGSDLHIFHGKNPFATYPRVIGHEFAGHIDAVGAGVSADRIGERVVVDPVIRCGQCHACRIGRHNVCQRLQVIGVHRDGGFSQFACVPADNAYAVPAGMPTASAAVIETFAVAANATHRTGVLPTDVALIYGAGPVGLNLLQVLKGVYGVRTFITDHVDERLALARGCGAEEDEVINTAREPLARALARRGVAGGPTLIFDAVCHPAILEEAVALAAPAGRIGVLGFSATPSALPQQALTSKELTLYASRLNCAMFPTVIDWITRGRVDPGRIVTHQIPFRDVADAFALSESQPRACCKVLLDLSEDA